MTNRPFALLAYSFALALLLSAPAAAQSASDPAALRTPDGHPDLSGVWDFRTVTPIERPTEFENQEFLSEEEVAAYAAERVLASNADLNREEKKKTTTARGQVNGTRESTDLALAYNDFWWDRGTEAVETRRTSLVIDPANGRIPMLTDLGPTGPPNGSGSTNGPRKAPKTVRSASGALPASIQDRRCFPRPTT